MIKYVITISDPSGVPLYYKGRGLWFRPGLDGAMKFDTEELAVARARFVPQADKGTIRRVEVDPATGVVNLLNPGLE